MQNTNNQGGILKKIFSKKNIYYFLYTTLMLSFIVIYIIINAKLQIQYNTARRNLYLNIFDSEKIFTFRKIFEETEILVNYYRFILSCVFIIGAFSGITLFKYIGFKIEVKKVTKEEATYVLIGSLIPILITLILVVLVFLFSDKEQIADYSYENYIFIFFIFLNAMNNLIVKKKIKKLEIAKKKLELGVLNEKD